MIVKWCVITGKIRGLTVDRYLRDPHRYNECFWVPRPWEWVDPEKDVDALIKLKEAGWHSDEMYLQSRGIGLEQHYEQLKKEKTLKKEKDIQSNIDLGIKNNPSPKKNDKPEDGEQQNLYLSFSN